MRTLLRVSIITALFAGSTAGADVLNSAFPRRLLFIGLVAGEWRMFVGDETPAPRHIPTASEPRTPAYSATLARISYISDAGELREVDLSSGKDAVLLKPTAASAYTQPAYRPASDELYAVALRDGSSIETDIVRVERTSQQPVVVLRQRSAQFEPAFTPDGKQLVYSNVLCASECPTIIQEIWTLDMPSGAVRQLTSLNAVSRQPAAGTSGALVFASNADGSYQLWRMDPTTQPRRVTRDSAIDDSPAVTDNGDIYFIRRTPGGGKLMHMSAAGATGAIALHESITDVRDVRWGR